ncbi:MAG TPA: GAF domain-containing protein [Solirubrobacteraceae bacterium]|nr:GAF domain-containing protein [Solirubrobacteraceae bacterium]
MRGEELRLLAQEQAALRRVATLVARGAAPEEVFEAVVEEVGRLLPVDFADMGRYEPGGTLVFVGSWGNPVNDFPLGTRWVLGGRNLGTIVFETARPGRIDSYADASGGLGAGGRERGFRSAVGTPIIVEGRVWGVVIAGSMQQPLPADTELRLADFNELLATAVANAESHARLTRLAQEQAALRRVATLVARGSPPENLFAAIVNEVGHLLDVDIGGMGRYESDGTVNVVASWRGAMAQFPVGTRLRLGGSNLITRVFETGCSARMDRYAEASGPIGLAAIETGLQSAVATPIIVEDSLWGVLISGSSRKRPLPADTESRLAAFTELLATAIANAESRAGLARLAQEQAALRRVATLVARGAPREDVFAGVVGEAGRLLAVDFAGMARYEPDGAMTYVASWGRAGSLFPVGSRLALGGKNVSTLVFETGRGARIDHYVDASGAVGGIGRQTGFRSAVATPITVEDRVWGVMTAGSILEWPLAADTEDRLASFTELVATAIANTESRAGLARLAEEQAALRRVATLVARGSPPEAVAAAVAEEVVRLLPVDYAHMGRYEADGVLTILASCGTAVGQFPVGTRLALGTTTLAKLVFENGRPARIDTLAGVPGTLAAAAREHGIRSAVATPIIVEGRLWGVMGAGSILEQRRLADTEARLVEFTDLVATAIANGESRAALAASRARIVAASDQVRRRIERDLHDGAQQRLVSLGLELRAAQATVPSQLGELDGELSRVADGLRSVFEELREISRGIHPAILSERGLESALRVLARRSPLLVELDLHVERRPPEHLEAVGYYVVFEALTNAVKHAHASVVHVDLDADDTIMRLTIHDDGVGGADPGKGAGLVGLSDRIEALGGTVEVASPTGGGTTLLIEVPVAGRRSARIPAQLQPGD